jgi:hypothetical protein
MVYLYWFGRIVGDLLGDRRVLPTYLLGGLAGGLAFFLFANLQTRWDVGVYALGASAAMTCVLLLAGKTAPDYNIPLLFLGDVKLKYIVAVVLLLDVIGLSWNSNSGGSIAHLGGAFMGYLIALKLQNGNDLTRPVNNILDKITAFFKNVFSTKPRGPKVAYRNPNLKKQHQTAGSTRASRAAGQRKSDTEEVSHQEKLDAILDKIKQSGYDSLTATEKEFLFNASQK